MNNLRTIANCLIKYYQSNLKLTVAKMIAISEWTFYWHHRMAPEPEMLNIFR